VDLLDLFNEVLFFFITFQFFKPLWYGTVLDKPYDMGLTYLMGGIFILL
jgi:hypothetical protein